MAVEKAALSSRVTHGARAAVDACRYLAGLLVGAVNGVSKDELLSEAYRPNGGKWGIDRLAPEIYEIICGSFKHREPPEILGSGYVVKSLEAALWAFNKSTSFREGCLMAVNLGEDADTTGAVFGQLAGAYYGIDGIPANWLRIISYRELIEDYAGKIYQLSQLVS
jgi:ADP-ribosylglycohydrolase